MPRCSCKNHSTFLSMDSFAIAAFLTLLSTLFFLPIFPATTPSSSDTIHLACRATLFPSICMETLTNDSSLSSNSTIIQIILSAIAASSSDIDKTRSSVSAINHPSKPNLNLTAVIGNCHELLNCSLFRSESTARLFSNLDNHPNSLSMKDARAWMSAAVQGLYGCLNGLSYVNDTTQIVETMSFINNTISRTSNALSIIRSLDIYGYNLSEYSPPNTERDGFWEPLMAPQKTFEGEVPTDLPENVTVCKSCQCSKIQDAVDGAPENLTTRYVIRIRAGVYSETVRIPFRKTNLAFLGDGAGKTIITGSSHVSNGVFTYQTATLAVLGDRFMLSDVTVNNTAGPYAHQAVALRLDCDQCTIYRCEFLGHQDTLYASSLRQYYKSCLIVGTVDFIFGNSQSLFRDCTILVTTRQEGVRREKNTLTAQGRFEPDQSTGFVFERCVVNGTIEYLRLFAKNPSDHLLYLGRPWKLYSRAVFINCSLGAIVNSVGWLAWDTNALASKTLYFGESENHGPGSNLSKRVLWSSKIPRSHLMAYSVSNFMQGDSWIPTTN